MSRYINADELLKYLSVMYDRQNDEDEPFNCAVLAMSYHIKDAPTIDAVEVVRCKDCKHYHVETYLLYGDCETLKWCDILNIRGKIPPDPKPMDFCSYGERKDHE